MTDDRMDRAERISNMRSGNRGTDDADDDSTDDGKESQSPTGDAESSAADETDDRDTSAGESATANEDTGSSSTDSDDTSTGSDPSPGGAATSSSQAADSEPTTDAQAAAQRAAESAAEVMGAGESGATAASEGAETGATGDTPGATGASTVPGDISGVELPDQHLLEAAMATSSVESTEGGARAAMEGEATQSEEVVRVLEFALGEEYYCLDIEYVEEIVKRDAVTRVPNTPAFVDGVVDLRGQITTILEPKEMMDIEGEGDQNLIIVFDPDQFEDQGAIGWVVDEVRQVVPVPESDINHPPVDAEYINGVVDREEYDEFVIWVEPEDALAQATATENE
ncbi:chemotaxis protein CheW [Haloarcula sediminis]|uniref:chemotaxis protein CheW n=1 Tax=Haloarcula sediminis TaxID=3111777 RepID=UPI002D7747D2|nr:chemotaxis protein CheW [Haloarcula sp. CK38]